MDGDTVAGGPHLKIPGLTVQTTPKRSRMTDAVAPVYRAHIRLRYGGPVGYEPTIFVGPIDAEVAGIEVKGENKRITIIQNVRARSSR